MTTTTDLTKFTDVDKYLKNLELKTYSLKEIADIIRNITSLCKEGLFVDDYNDNFYKDLELIMHPKTGEKISLEDCYVDLTYQRVLKLKQLVDHLRATDRNNNPMQYDKMCAGSIDIAIRPDSKIFVWDGFRRSLIALLKGIRYPLFSSYVHPKTNTIKDCRATEAFAFKKRNGDNESMAKEELYKSGIVFENPKDLKTRNCLEESQLDVLKTIPDAVKDLGGFAEYEKYLHDGTVTESQLTMSSLIMTQAWKEESTISSYVILGNSMLMNLLEEPNALSWSYNITARDDESCDFLPKFKKFAENGGTMSDLVRNRLSNMGVATVAYRIAIFVLGVDDFGEQVELCEKLGFDNEAQKILVTAEQLKKKTPIAIAA
jgi:hypothetical protein|tara:strand:- start:1243 stop:2367 length:1125 start_codon:yes stop_codon:yes gene_type:complete